MIKSILNMLSFAVLGAGAFSIGAAPSWPDIKVGLKADQPVSTTPSLKEQADGFRRSAITLSQPWEAATEARENHRSHSGDRAADGRSGDALAAFGKTEPVKLEARHSTVLKYEEKDSFAKLCQKLQSR